MFKKIALLITIFGVFAQKPFCSESNPLYYLQDENARVVTSFKGNNLVITPNYAGNNWLEVQTKEGMLFIKTSPNEPEITYGDSPNMFVGNSFKQDLTQYDTFQCIQTSHNFHNAGYWHAASQQDYAGCSFMFTNPTAQVKLTSKSQGLSYMRANSGTDPLSLLFSSLSQNLLKPAQVASVQAHDKAGGQNLGILSSVSVRPVSQAGTFPFSGHLNFPASTFHFATQGTVVELEPNHGYVFTPIQ